MQVAGLYLLPAAWVCHLLALLPFVRAHWKKEGHDLVSVILYDTTIPAGDKFIYPEAHTRTLQEHTRGLLCYLKCNSMVISRVSYVVLFCSGGGGGG